MNVSATSISFALQTICPDRIYSLKFTSGMFLPITVAAALIHIIGTCASSSPTFKGSYLSSPLAFEIDVDRSFISETIQRVKQTRLPVDIDQPDLLDGPPVHNATAVRDYWIDEYDWFAVQDGLNEQYVHYSSVSLD